jgi:peptide/nickel transport system substrate-binding protein
MRRSAWALFAINSSGVVGVVACTSVIAALARAETRPRYGGTVAAEIHHSITFTDPAEWPIQLVPLVYDRLTRLDARGRPQPALAVAWQHDPENRRWQFRLRTGVRFHDGTPVTAAAVAASLKSVSRIESSGEDTVVIDGGSPAPDLPAELAGARYAILRRGPDGVTAGTGPFRIAEWQPGRRALLTANEDYWGGRPYLDSIELQMGRAYRDQSIDLELGRADMVELSIEDARRLAPRSIRTSTSAPVDLMALVFDRGHSAAEIARLREAVALSVDRATIHTVLLQRHGEPTGALLPAWLSGYAFLFPTARDLNRAKQIIALLPKTATRLTFAFDAADPLSRTVAERVALNAREAGITMPLAPGERSDVRLVRLRLGSVEPAQALSEFAAAAGFSDLLKPMAPATPEALYASERAVLEEFRVVPLFHLPIITGIGSRVRNWETQRWGEWRLEDVWVDARKP